MTPTDELRRMLTEAGVEWMPSVWSAKDETFYKVGDVGYLATELSSGKMKVCIEGYPTPAQAIAATVGRDDRESYDAGFASGIKATLQQLYGLLHEYPTLDEIEAWADSQWEVGDE